MFKKLLKTTCIFLLRTFISLSKLLDFIMTKPVIATETKIEYCSRMSLHQNNKRRVQRGSSAFYIRVTFYVQLEKKIGRSDWYLSWWRKTATHLTVNID